MDKGYKSLIDIGTGWGEVPKKVKGLKPDMRIVGIDIAKTYIDEAKNDPTLLNIMDMVRNPDLIYDTSFGVHFEVGDARKMKYKDKSFDMAFTCGTLIHIPKKEIKKTVREILRVAKHALFIESSVHLPGTRKMKYDPKSYWTLRAKRRYKNNSDDEIRYYFAHDYPKVFKELGLKHKVIRTFDKKTNTKAYLI